MNPFAAIALKAVLTAIFIVGVSELAKRSNFVSALIVGLPLTSALTIAWLYLDTNDAARAAHYSASILWLLPPGCVFLAALPLFIRLGAGFWPGFAGAVAVTGLVYYAYAIALQRVFGVTL
jgi:hypothetical protein